MAMQRCCQKAGCFIDVCFVSSETSLLQDGGNIKLHTPSCDNIFAIIVEPH